MTKTSETYISFYLRANRIHVFIDSLRGLGSPKRVCFLMDDNGNTLVLIPYGKRDLVSHKVPEEAYIGSKDMEISSKKLCRLLAALHKWDTECSYRIPGIILSNRRMVKYDLTKAQSINSKPITI